MGYLVAIACLFGSQLRGRGRPLIILCAVLLTGCSNPLAEALAEGDVEQLEALLHEGADANAVISFSHPAFAGGNTVKRRLLVAAAVYGNPQVVDVLVRNGATPTLSGNDFAICAAAAFGHEAVVRILLDAGASPSPSRKCGKDGNHSPLSIARAGGHAAVVELLEAAGSNQ